MRTWRSQDGNFLQKGGTLLRIILESLFCKLCEDRPEGGQTCGRIRQVAAVQMGGHGLGLGVGVQPSGEGVAVNCGRALEVPVVAMVLLEG